MAEVGRPTKYTEEMPKKLLDFFNRSLETEVLEQTASQGKVVEVKKVKPNKFPTFERFSADNNLHHSTLLEWAKKYPEFSEAYKQCKNIQKDFIIQHGLTGGYNAGFAKFVAINCTDMEDSKTEAPPTEIKVILPDERATKL